MLIFITVPVLFHSSNKSKYENQISTYRESIEGLSRVKDKGFFYVSLIVFGLESNYVLLKMFKSR